METFVDASRPTAEHGPVPASTSRTLQTTILFPAATDNGPPDTAGGPYPLIVFGHGSGGLGTRYLPMLRTWAAAGYVVAAPVFPFAATGGNDATSTDDYPNQPADMAFAISGMLRLNFDASSPLKGSMDADRVGAAGHSLGAMTTLALAANTCCRDPRVKAAAVLSGRELPFGSGSFFTRIRVPLLLIHGDADNNVPYSDARRTYGDAPPPRFLVTLFGGDHSAPYDPPDSRAAQLTAKVVVDFFDQYLKGATDGLRRIQADAGTGGVAKLESET